MSNDLRHPIAAPSKIAVRPKIAVQPKMAAPSKIAVRPNVMHFECAMAPLARSGTLSNVYVGPVLARLSVPNHSPGSTMVDTMRHAPSEVEYRFNHNVSAHTCPLCGADFEPRVGSWPFLAGSADPVCAGDQCPVGDDVTGTSPCDTLFRFAMLQQATLDAIAATAAHGESVAERLRRVAFDESLSDPDRAILQLAAIDLQFCEANTTRIKQIEPRLIVHTCGEAAAELLLSGCGEIVT